MLLLFVVCCYLLSVPVYVCGLISALIPFIDSSKLSLFKIRYDILPVLEESDDVTRKVRAKGNMMTNMTAKNREKERRFCFGFVCSMVV